MAPIAPDSSTVPIQIYLLVAIVVLQNASDALDRLNILIRIGVEVVERRSGAGVSIGTCEINCDGKVDGASAGNVLKKRVRVLSLACFNFCVVEG